MCSNSKVHALITTLHIYSSKVLVVQSCPTLCRLIDCSPLVSCPWNSPGKNTGVGSHSLLQAIFPTQESNPGLLHCRWILYQLSHRGNPRILEWVACSFSSGSSWPRNWTGVSYLAGGFFTKWAIREAQYLCAIHVSYDEVSIHIACAFFYWVVFLNI